MKISTRSVDDRYGVIGASSIGAMLGVSQFRGNTPYRVWNEAINGIAPHIDAQTEERFETGHLLEELVAKILKDRYGFNFEIWDGDTEIPPCFQSEREGLDFLVCHPDRIAITSEGKYIPIEIKSSSSRMDKKWGSEGTDQIPYDYLLQCYGYFLCGVGDNYTSVCEKVLLFRWHDNTLSEYIIARPDDDFLDSLATKIRKIWELWQDGEMPTLTTYDEAKSFYRPKEGSVEVTSEVMEKLSEICKLSSEIKSLEEKQDTLKKEVLEFMGGSSSITNGGLDLCTYKEQISRRFNTTAFKKNCPDLYDAYTEEKPTRVFRIKGEAK